MKSRGITQVVWTGAFLIGLLLALPGPAGASGFTHAQQHGTFRHAFQQHRFGNSGQRHNPRFFRDDRGFRRRHDPHFRRDNHGFRHDHRFRHPGFFHSHPGIHGGRVIFWWK
ncbi:MAG: hypothetical protein U1B94_10605 [candidate division NC10 bacterium]|nr:hypothetical protein [candidate division NC10 bacterium]